MSSPSEILVRTGVETSHGFDPEAPPRKPKRVLHFSDGTLEEYSDDEELRDPVEIAKTNNLKSTRDSKAAVPAKSLDRMRWGEYLLHITMNFGVKSLGVCDYLGEKFAWMLGITSPKYGYAIEEREWQRKEERREKEREDAARAKRNAVQPKDDLDALNCNNNGGLNLNSDPEILSSEKEKY